MASSDLRDEGIKDKTIYYGETYCMAKYKSGKKKGQQCSNKAYYERDNSCFCGVHCRGNRTKLPINPRAKENKLEAQQLRDKLMLEKMNKNNKVGKRGDVIVTKLRMMKPVDYKDGYRPIFPNFKHKNRKDGYGCPALSPKSLGPVKHIMPNLPPAFNLENFHQFAKVWSFELDSKGNQKPEYVEARRKAYLDQIPHRHKYDRKELAKIGPNVNIPAFSLYYKADGTVCCYSYFGCRYFYCKVYEDLASKTFEFKQLREWLKNGMNLQIVGYDGYNITKSVLEHYYDTSRPFGHELVLYTMLVIDNSDDYPWNVVYHNNEDTYKGVAF